MRAEEIDMSFSRRQFFLVGMAATARLARGAGLRGLKIGVTDWNLRLASKLEAIAVAKSLGFQGVEVSLGREAADNKLLLDHAEIQAEYLTAFRTHDLGPAGTCLDILHVNYLKNDKLGQKWVADGIRVTKALGAKVMLLPFFGRGALQTQQEKDYVADILKDLAPEAARAGVTLGLEDTISAEDNVRMVERAGSKSLQVYYDIGNSTINGFDVVREIEWLGKKRICQIHIKDNPGYLGEGRIDIAAVMRAISRIGFEGYANLETASPSKVIQADMKRNLSYVRKVVQEVRQG